jgi:hypothetical protein
MALFFCAAVFQKVSLIFGPILKIPISYDMQPAKVARQTYQYFSTLEGNHIIASVYALEKIVALAQRYKVKTVLEVGLGIGSISHAVLSYAKATGHNLRYIGTEANEFCLQALPRNLKADFSKIELYSSIDQVPADARPDLIIVDGSDANLAKLQALAAPSAILFVEGCRAQQVKALQSYFPKALSVETISAFKNPTGGPYPTDKWACGGSIIFTQPTALQRCQYWDEKITTTLRYRLWRPLKG